MAKNTRKANKANGATIPPVAVVVHRTTPTPLAVGAPVQNPTNTNPPLGNIRDFIVSNALTTAGGKLGQALLGREIGRHAFAGTLADDKSENGLDALVKLSVAETARAVGKTPAVGAEAEKKVKGLVSKMRQCFKVGALSGIGRAAIDNCYEYAFNAQEDGERIFPTLVSAARVQRDRFKEGILSDEQLKAALNKPKEIKSDDVIRQENVRKIGNAIAFATNANVDKVENEQPALSPAHVKLLSDFAAGPLATLMKELGMYPNEDDAKEDKRMADAAAKLLADQKAFAARVGKMQ